MHVGSLGMSVDQITQGARQLLQLAEKINKAAGKRKMWPTRSVGRSI